MAQLSSAWGSPPWAELLGAEPGHVVRAPANRGSWALLPLYLEELEGLCLQGLGGQRGEGRVQPVFAVAQHGVFPERGICPKHSARGQQQLPQMRELTSHSHPHFDLWGRQGFNRDTWVVLGLHPECGV